MIAVMTVAGTAVMIVAGIADGTVVMIAGGTVVGTAAGIGPIIAMIAVGIAHAGIIAMIADGAGFNGQTRKAPAASRGFSYLRQCLSYENVIV